MPPLLVDFIHARACKPFCENSLTLPSSLGLSAWRWACAVLRCGSMWPHSGQRKQQTRTPRQSALGSDLLRLKLDFNLDVLVF